MAMTFRVEAETSDLIEGFKVESLGVASGGAVLKALNKAAVSRASFVFSGEDATYDLDIGHFDENDGEATLAVLVNGVEIDSFVFDQDLGSPLATEMTRAVHQIADVALMTGDVIELVGNKEGGEPVRTDFIDFTSVDDILT